MQNNLNLYLVSQGNIGGWEKGVWSSSLLNTQPDVFKILSPIQHCPLRWWLLPKTLPSNPTWLLTILSPSFKSRHFMCLGFCITEQNPGAGLASRNSFFLYHHPTLLGGPPVLQLTSRRGGRHLLQESFCDPIFWAMHPSSIMASVTLV